MRTEVRIRFAGNHIPGGAQAVLGPAQCGPEVATVEDVPVLRQVVVWVTLDRTDPRLPLLLQLLRQNGEDWLEYHQDYYSDEELNEARLIVLLPRGQFQVFGGPRLGTRYDMVAACSVCGTGARQTSALIIDGADLPKLEGLHAASTYYSDILVEEPLAEEIERIGAPGLSFRSVYAVMEDKRQVKLRWRQMCAAHTLPPMSRRSTGIEREDVCKTCGRGGFVTMTNEPSRLVYLSEDLVASEDVNTTWEWFGEASFDGDVSDALFPYPWLLVSPKVWRVLRAAGADSFDWSPVRVEDA